MSHIFLHCFFPPAMCANSPVVSDPATLTCPAVTCVTAILYKLASSAHLHTVPTSPSAQWHTYQPTSIHSQPDYLLCFCLSVPAIFSACPSFACYDPLPSVWTSALWPDPLLDKSPLPA